MNNTLPVVLTLILSLVALFVQHVEPTSGFAEPIDLLSDYVEYAVLILLVGEFVAALRSVRHKRVYLKRNVLQISFVAVFCVLLAYNKIVTYTGVGSDVGSLPIVVVIIRNVSLLFGVFGRLRRLSSFLEQISVHPARTILLSFLAVIVAGTLFLMMPFTAADGEGLGFIDALFTATSAVCVTGLIVVDTATAFSVPGQLIILGLIQIGGLGIMILSYFTVFVLRRSVSVEDKMLISYILSERDMTKLSRTLKTIIYTTFLIEAAGAAALFFGMRETVEGSIVRELLFAVFHSVSAFCNAGFSLFSDSLEGLRDNGLVVSVVAVLIILGGLSFGVLTNLRAHTADRLKNVFRRRRGPVRRLSVNTKAVCAATVLLLVSGLLIVYGLEHRGVLASYDLGGQYLSAFFQSVTLRTAGFNTIPFGGLAVSSYMVMAAFMFVGGASGSTAGGIKVNTVVVLGAYVRSRLQDNENVVLFRHSVPMQIVLRSFMILMFGVIAVGAGTVFLSIFESAPLEDLLFEVVSAFGTVGLSAGVTGSLSQPGRVVISLLMFLGRLGPLTVLAAASVTEKRVKIEYPRGEISVG